MYERIEGYVNNEKAYNLKNVLYYFYSQDFVI